MSTSRLGECEVCGKNDAKYTCPGCEVKTCCLSCVVIHKKELDCNGIRNRVKYKTVKSFSNMDLQNDYRLLEEIGRSAEKYSKDRRVHGYFELPKHLYRLRAAASRRNVDLHFLPRDFQKNKRNTTYLDFKTQELFWRIEWIFPQAEDVKYVNERVIDSELLGNVLENYINPSRNDDKKLKYYHAIGHPGIIILLKAEKNPGNRFFELDVRSSVRENLTDKIIIEFPVLHVILKDHKQCYDIITPDEEEEIIKKRLLERFERDQKGSNKRKFDHRGYSNLNKNLLFPTEDHFDDVTSSVNSITSTANFKESSSVEKCSNNVNGNSNNNSRNNHDLFIPHNCEL